MTRKQRTQTYGGNTFPITYKHNLYHADNAIGNGDRRHC